MAVNLSPVGNGFQFFSNDGLPLAGGKIQTYQAGSTTPLATYTDSSGLIANTNPIILGTSGRPPSDIWLTEGVFYKFVLSTATDVVIQTYDNLYGIIGVAQSPPTPTPAGVIVMWSGSIGSIPAGWALCNGNNGTPDLRDRFVVGAGSTYAVDATGGSTTTIATGSITGSTQSTTLTTNQIPSHSHISGDWRIFDATAPEYGIGSTATKTNPLGRNVTTATAYLSNTSSTGGGQGHTHGAGTLTFNGNAVTSLPPYYALCYIMKT